MNRDPLEVLNCVAHIEHVGIVCSPFFVAQCHISSLAVNSLRERERERERELFVLLLSLLLNMSSLFNSVKFLCLPPQGTIMIC